MTTRGEGTEREAKRSERMLKVSLVMALGLMAILLGLCMSSR